MTIRLIPGALVIIGLIAVAAPLGPSVAESRDIGLFSSKSIAANATTYKHRYWRYRGGRHPHYGSRRIRT
jgi:hypothetical protein